MPASLHTEAHHKSQALVFVFDSVVHGKAGSAPATFKWGGLTDSPRAGVVEAFCEGGGGGGGAPALEAYQCKHLSI